MKILIKQFLGKWHSWSTIGWALADAWIKQGHQVDLFSTDGIKYLPEHLKQHLVGYTEENDLKVIGRSPPNNYDMQYSYTAMKNFTHMFVHSTNNKFGQWTSEWTGKNVLPPGFAKHYKACSKVLAPTNYTKNEMFVSSGIPAGAIEVVPHGINDLDYQKQSTIKLPTDKKFKICVNLVQLHRRKNIPGLLEAYGKAFNKNDDVCLIIKAKDKKPVSQFEVSLSDNLQAFKKKYSQHAEIKIYSDFIDDMSDLYRSIDAVFSMAHGEGFNMPILEGLAAGKLAIVPEIGPHVDFTNQDNSLYIKSERKRADIKSMYWTESPYAEWVVPNIDNAAEQLQFAHKNYEELNNKIKLQQPKILQQYSWNTISKSIVDLCK